MRGWLRSFFSYGRICQVPLEELRQKLISVFLRWGKCGAMRVDNGEPLGCPQAGITSALALWLIANDIDMIFNPPRCPQANAKVERMQATSAKWAEIHKAQSLQTLQMRLETEATFHRAEFPVSRLKYQTRLQVFPELETSRRVFDVNDFDEKRVYEFLARKIYARSVSKSGQISHFGQKISVGSKYRYQTVEIKFDAEKCTWNVYAQNNIIKSFLAQNLKKDRIQNLTVMSMNKT